MKYQIAIIGGGPAGYTPTFAAKYGAENVSTGSLIVTCGENSTVLDAADLYEYDYTDNTQLTVFGGFAPNSQSAEVLSKALGEQTVLSGSVSNGRDRSQSLQMIGRPLMTVDELKSMPKGQFIVMKTGTHPMISKLKLFFKWGIKFEEEYKLPDKTARAVSYKERDELIKDVEVKYPQKKKEITLEYEELTAKKKTTVKT